MNHTSTLFRSQAVPELEDLTAMGIVRGCKEGIEAMTTKWKGENVRHDGEGLSAVL